jgi:hypothetical protein
MKKKTRPLEPVSDELQRLLKVEHPGELPDAVRELQAQAAGITRARQALDGLLKKLEEEIEREQS